MEGFDHKPLGLEKFSQVFGVLAGGAVNHHRAVAVKPLPQEPQNDLLFFMRRRRPDLVMEIVPLMAAGERIDPQTEIALDQVNDLALDVAFGRGGEALHRRNPRLFFLGEFENEPDGVR